MHYLLAATIVFGILTLWVPGYWAVAVFEVSMFGLAVGAVLRSLRAPPRFAYPLAPLLFAVFWGLLQYCTGRTVSPFETRIALARWATLLAVFIAGLVLFQKARVHRWFRSSMLWFGFLVAVLATLQTFTAGGKVFWIFQTENIARVMGPILSPNHYAAFMEVVLPLAIYGSFRPRRDALLYSGMAAVMYASVIASASRAGFVLASVEIVTVAALLWLQGRTSERAVGRSLVRVALLLAVFTAVVGWGKVWERLQTPDPFANRREFAISSMRMISARPWFGFGLGAWPVVYPAYAIVDTGKFANRAHDDWLEWTAEGGLPFGVAMATLFLWCLRPAFGSAWGVGVVAVFLHATVDYPFSRPALAAWIVVMIALLATRKQSAASELKD
ncbi:MAG: O-antigen ligase family protein [Bryobacteraceae bacterium]|jgi:O-antigen ligase